MRTLWYVAGCLNFILNQTEPFLFHPPGKICKSNSSLSDHARSNCGRDPIYQCDECDKHFRSMGSLKCHKTIHSQKLDFTCTFCEKRFRTKGQLTVHLRSHTKEKTFHCQLCPAAFSHRESLITHNSKIINIIDKTFLNFTTKSNFPSTAIHTGIKRFRCNMCDARFSCLSNFFTHRKNHTSCAHATYEKVKEAETSVKNINVSGSQIIEVSSYDQIVVEDGEEEELQDQSKKNC